MDKNQLIKIKKLRSATAASIKLCKESLEESHYDFDKALKVLRDRLGSVLRESKRDRVSDFSKVFIAAEDGKAAMLTLKAETDFALKSEAFLKLGDILSKMSLDNEVSRAEDLSCQKSSDIINDYALKLGENIVVQDIQLAQGSVISSYVHGDALGCVVVLERGSASDAYKLAVQSVGYKSKFVNELCPTFKERMVSAENLKEDEVEAFVKDLAERYVLTEQACYFSPSQTVGEFIASKGIVISKILRNF